MTTSSKDIVSKLPEIMASKPKGRPRKYQKKFAEIARAMSFIGATQSEVALFLNVSDKTITNWRRLHLEFDDAMKEGHYANSAVALKLHERAVGYTAIETKREYAPNEDGEVVLVKETITEKEIPASVQAQMAWLPRRDPQHWSPTATVEDSQGDLVERLLEGRERARLENAAGLDDKAR